MESDVKYEIVVVCIRFFCGGVYVTDIQRIKKKIEEFYPKMRGGRYNYLSIW